MANREELGIIRGARAGDAGSQLALGKLYLFGGASLPRSMPTALHWLNRAALQQQDEAWMLIGNHISFEHAQHGHPTVLAWYDRAYDAGVEPAGLVLAQLVLNNPDPLADQQWRNKALRALETAASAGSVEAQWLLARHAVDSAAADADAGPATALPAGGLIRAGGLAGAGGMGGMAAPLQFAHGGSGNGNGNGNGTAALAPAAGQGQQWMARAVDNSVAAAQYALLDTAWEQGHAAFLQRARPVLRSLLSAAPPDAEAARAADWPLAPPVLRLLSRCAEVLAADLQPGAGSDPDLQHCRELAAYGGQRHAQLALGLWFARMKCDGERLPGGIAAVNFKRAIRWLTLAGEQGLADAWFALSRIYVKPEFSQRCVAESQAYLERAADMGHCAAQLECGMYAWRNRRADPDSDVRAAYWLQKAAAQGCPDADAALVRIAPPASGENWAGGVLASLTRELMASQPLLAARIELAGVFGLSRAEALLLDVKSADHGHCLVVDIRASYGRSKRRLILLRTARERQALDRAARLFDQVDGGPDGPEGNYRQRLYRIKTWLPHAATEQLLAA